MSSIYANVLEQKPLQKKEVNTPTGLARYHNMAAVSLFWNTNTAAVTSCENAPLQFLYIMYFISIFLISLFYIFLNIFPLTYFFVLEGRKLENCKVLTCPFLNKVIALQCIIQASPEGEVNSGGWIYIERRSVEVYSKRCSPTLRGIVVLVFTKSVG